MKGSEMYRVAVAVFVLLAPAAAYAQGPPVIEGFYPQQLVPGQTTVIHMGINGRQQVTGIEITPAAGITVKNVTTNDTRQNQGWWDITIEVAKDAAPGSRMMVATGPMVRTAPRAIMVPAAAPTISDLKVVSAVVSQPTVELQFAMTETPNAVGDAPGVFYMLHCGGEPEVGLARGKAGNGVVRVLIPNPRTQQKPGAEPLKNQCELEVRASDSKKADSNTLKTAVEFK
jgi:hypothetical protein